MVCTTWNLGRRNHPRQVDLIRDAGAEGLDVPFPERVQIVIVTTPLGDVEVVDAHVPAATSSGVAVKVATFEGIARFLARPTTTPRILCGDPNTPKTEAFGQTHYWGDTLQQQAERAVIEGRATHGLRDAFRHVHGPGATAASWRASAKATRRCDHIFASEHLVTIEARYGDLEQMRSAGISDHAPLRVVFMRSPESHGAAPDSRATETRP